MIISWLKIVAVLSVVALFAWALRGYWLSLIGDYLIVANPLQHAEVIHVIAGEDFRTDYAIQLYKEGCATTLFYTGGWCKSHKYHHGQHAEAVSLAAGVPATAIAFDDSPVDSTYTEAQRLKSWMDLNLHPIHSVIVVSDPFHMRRVQWTYGWVLGSQIQVRLAPVPFDQTPYQRAWWNHPKSRNYVRNEYQKLAYYLLRYRLSKGRFQNWLASLDRS